MEEWTEIRRKVLRQGVPKRQVMAEYGLGYRTLEKILSNPEPPGYRSTTRRTKPKLGSFIDRIAEILEADRDAPAKQRHTAKRIFERLRDEHGYTGCESQVRAEVARHRRHAAEVYVPISHPPGEAEFDFGEAWVVIAGVLQKGACATTCLPHSDVFLTQVYPRENTECFQQAHADAFSHFDGVPTRIIYDNTAIAVSKITRRARELTDGFLRLESHYLFTHHFCNCASGWEKGNVEGKVGYGRRNFMVPVPHAASFAELNGRLKAQCLADQNRRIWGQDKTKAELFEEDRARMLVLPEAPFEARRVTHVRANSMSMVRFHGNAYSVPTAYAHHECVVSGGISEVEIASDGDVVARHPRCWEHQRKILDPRHYLALLERKPGALDVAKPLEHWELPECFHLLRRRLEADLGDAGTREYIKVLRLSERVSVGELASAVSYALSIGATAPEAIDLILRHRRERPVALFALDRHPHLSPYRIDPPDLAAYGSLKGA